MTDPKRNTITVPKNVRDAAGRIAELDALIVAKQWEKAALIAAYTAPGQLSHRELADAAGISMETIKTYRRIWLNGGGDINIRPGSTVTLPTKPWPGVTGGRCQPVTQRRQSLRAQFTRALSDLESLRRTLKSANLNTKQREALRDEVATLENAVADVAETLTPRRTAKRLGGGQ